MQTNNLIYGNCSVLSPDGILMFRCNNKKANWYLNRGLADIIKDTPLTIKLNFTPNGLGNHKKGYGLSEMKNKCVNCGNEDNLTRHHVVPISYRKYFPIEIKSHNFHDILPMCVKCHEIYERKADNLKKLLSNQYNAPLTGEIVNNGLYKYKKMAITLLNNNKIPPKGRLDIKNKIKEKFQIKKLTKNRLVIISNMESIYVKKTHGEIVMNKISDIKSFIEMWRKHFIENNDCKYLPKTWKIDYQK